MNIKAIERTKDLLKEIDEAQDWVVAKGYPGWAIYDNLYRIASDIKLILENDMKRQDQEQPKGADPIHEHDGQWWFWD